MNQARIAKAALLALLAMTFLVAPGLAEYRNGRNFDPGRGMTHRADGAPAQLDRVSSWLGQWDVSVLVHRADNETAKFAGQAEITWMNRGHALMENFYSEDLDGHELAAIRFLGFNPASKRWFLGGADSWSESAWVADGDFEGDVLSLTDTQRRGGGVTRTELRYRVEQSSPDSLLVTVDESGDGGASWNVAEKRTYSRRKVDADFMKPASEFGVPAPDRPVEAAAFDFLLGEWDAAQDMTFPNGQKAQWASRGTAVYALNGAAIKEYNWFDVDPNLPDAATTILRLYNRAMRRWECLYVSNRGHGILFFGGVEEGDDIVLRMFSSNAAAPRMPRWVFHDIEPGSYSWYAESSLDRGKSWTKTWQIDGKRKSAASQGE